MVLWAIAEDDSGKTVDISSADHDAEYRCVACKGRMVSKRGSEVAWHFAHFRVADCWSRESSLHVYAKRLTEAGFVAALKENRKYNALVRCRTCGGDASLTLTDEADSVVLESLVPDSRVRPDALLKKYGEPVLAVEFVVAHAPDEATFSEYRRLKLPVLIVKPTWDSVSRLRNGIAECDALGVEKDCRVCTARSLRREAARRSFVNKPYHPPEIQLPKPEQLELSLPEKRIATPSPQGINFAELMRMYFEAQALRSLIGNKRRTSPSHRKSSGRREFRPRK